MKQIEIELRGDERSELDRLEGALRSVGAQPAPAETASEAAAAIDRYKTQILLNHGYDPELAITVVPDRRRQRVYVELSD